MSRRLVGMTVVAASLLAGTPHSFAATEAPRAVCAKRVNDIEGDAKINYGNSTEVRDPRDGTSVNALDLTSASVRVTADQVQVFVGLKAMPGTFGTGEAAYSYEVKFEIDSIPYTFKHAVGNSAFDGSSLKPSSLGNYPLAYFHNGATDTPMTGLAAELDADHKFIIVTVPRTEAQKGVESQIKDGTTVKNITAATYMWLPTSTGSGATVKNADTAAAADYVYTVGDDYCFGPPPAALSNLVLPSVHYTDSVTLSAVLSDEAGAKLAGKPVTFAVTGEKPLTKTTDANGVAKVTYKPTRPAGKYAVLVTFPGDAEVGQTKLSGTVTVLTEATHFLPLAVTKPSTTTRTVTATLLDDDNHAVAGQKVYWYVNGKKLTTPSTTTSTGKAVLKTAKPGQTVQAKFTAVTGKFAASSSASKKV